MLELFPAISRCILEGTGVTDLPTYFALDLLTNRRTDLLTP